MRTYAELLREEVVQAGVRQHRARRRRRAVAKVGAAMVVVAGVIVVLVGVLIAPGQEPASANDSVRVTREEDRTLVEIVAPDRPDDVIRDLRAAGLTADRVERPTGPSRIGMVVSAVVENSSSIPTQNAEGMLSAYVSGSAHLLIGVGVATPAGHAYEVATDAFEVGEPLHCRSWPGQPAEQFEEVARALGLSVSFLDEATGPVQAVSGDKVVRSATAVAADRVMVMVGEDATVTNPPAACSASPGGG